MPLNDCLVKINVPQGIKDYILSKKDAYIKQGLDEQTAERNAINEFKNETVNHLADLHSQLGNNKFIKNAIPEQSTNAVDVRQQTEDGESMGGGNTGNIEPPTENTESKVAGESSEATSIKNAVTQEHRKQLGLENEIPSAKKEFGETWQEAKDKIDNGYHVPDLIEELKKKPRPLTDVENAMLLHHQNTKELQVMDANKFINDAAEKGDEAGVAEGKVRKARIKDELKDIYDVDKAVGTENARGLNSRKMMVDRKYSLANMEADTRATVNDGKPLTESQTAEVEKLHEKIKKTQAAHDEYVKSAEEEIKNLQEKILGKKIGDKKTAAAKLRELADKVEKSNFGKANLPEGTQGAGVSIDINKLAAQAMRLVADGLEKGAELVEAIKKAVEQMKKDMPDIDEKLLSKTLNKQVIESGVISPSKETKDYSELVNKKGGLDRKALQLNADNQRAKNEYDATLKKAELQKRSLGQKVQDTFIKWERAFKLSNPVTMGKLGAAALTRAISTPLEDFVGAGYSGLLPKLAKGAIGEGGGLNVSETAKAYAQGTIEGAKDAYQIMKRKGQGKSNIDLVFGKSGHLPPEAIDFFGQVHSATKAPIKRVIFERQLQKRYRRSIAAGLEVSDPMVQSEIAIGAYKDANRAIFMQDNKVADWWQNGVRYLERVDPKTGKANSKALATTMQFLIPFVKVPTNIASEIGAHVYGVPQEVGKGIYNLFIDGTKDLTPDEKDIIFRNLKKGTLGLAALSLGYLNPKIFGGYYQEKEHRNPEDAKAGAVKIGGINFPAWLIESPIFQAMQIGATVRRVKDAKVHGEEKGIGEGAWAGLLGLADHVPMVDQPLRIAKAISDPKERQWYIGELAKGTVDPAALQKIAEWTDEAAKRKETNPLEHIESGIPGLRENLQPQGKGTNGGGGGATGGFKQIHKIHQPTIRR